MFRELDANDANLLGRGKRLKRFRQQRGRSPISRERLKEFVPGAFPERETSNDNQTSKTTDRKES